MNKAAIKHLSVDPILAQVIQVYGELLERDISNVDIFADLVESIISQQLSVKASDTINKRFLALFGNKFPLPGKILEMPDDKIRACGISYSKIKYIKGISEALLNKSLDLEALKRLPDEQVLAELIKLKGIGPWTAQMLLIFTFARPDIFSMGDLGLRSAIAKLYGVDRDDLKAIEKITLAWRPYRSLACRYLWKSLDNTPKE